MACRSAPLVADKVTRYGRNPTRWREGAHDPPVWVNRDLDAGARTLLAWSGAVQPDFMGRLL